MCGSRVWILKCLNLFVSPPFFGRYSGAVVSLRWKVCYRAFTRLPMYGRFTGLTCMCRRRPLLVLCMASARRFGHPLLD